MANFKTLLADIRACRICESDLPLGPRPIIRAGEAAKLLIIGQAPGTRVHESGVPWDDASGERLRGWLDMPSDIFNDENHVAIMPMGFCYPGRVEKGGDKPPRPECAPQWHAKVLADLTQVKLTLLVGSYAQKHYLGKAMKKTMTETVRAFRDYLPAYLPTPHPSWRAQGWEKKNPWFEAEVLPELRKRILRLPYAK